IQTSTHKQTTHRHTHTITLKYIHTHLYTYTHAYKHRHTHTLTHIQIYTHTPTHTYTDIHTTSLKRNKKKVGNSILPNFKCSSLLPQIPIIRPKPVQTSITARTDCLSSLTPSHLALCLFLKYLPHSHTLSQLQSHKLVLANATRTFNHPDGAF